MHVKTNGATENAPPLSGVALQRNLRARGFTLLEQELLAVLASIAGSYPKTEEGEALAAEARAAIAKATGA